MSASSIDRREALKLLGLGGIILASYPLARAVEAFAPVEQRGEFDALNNLSFRYVRDTIRSYKSDITGTKIAVWNTTNENVRYIHEVVSDQVFNSALKPEEYRDNTRVIAIQRRLKNQDGSDRWEAERVNQADAFIMGYTTGSEPCDNDGRPCKQAPPNQQRAVTVTELAYQIVNDEFMPYSGSSIQKENFQAPSGQVCNIWWAGKDVQQAPPALPTVTAVPTLRPTATPTSVRAPVQAPVQAPAAR